MPAAAFHEAVIRRVEGKHGSLNIRILGAQGPDPLFFYQMYHPWKDRRINALGNVIHSCRTSAFLVTLIDLAKTETERGYVDGFLAHYATDTVCHPFVYACSTEADGRYNGMCHMQLEAAADTWIWREDGHKGTPLYYECFPNSEELRIAARLVALAAEKVFPERPVSTDEIERAFWDVKRIERILYSRTGAKYRFFERAERLFGKPGGVTQLIPPPELPENDFLNLEKHCWKNPWTGEESCDSIPERLEKAVARTTELISLAECFRAGNMTADELAEKLGDRHYSSGAPWHEFKMI